MAWNLLSDRRVELRPATAESAARNTPKLLETNSGLTPFEIVRGIEGRLYCSLFFKNPIGIVSELNRDFEGGLYIACG
jgi:hypothetical protein